jgi:hypothetical protein
MFCPHCGKEVNDDQVFCHHCGGKIAAETSASYQRTGTPWEGRTTRGFTGGIIATLKESLFRPSSFFRKMPVTGGLTGPMLYAMIVTMTGIMASYGWQILVPDAFHRYLPHDWKGAAGIDVVSGIGLAVLAMIMPFLIILILFLWSGILHLLLQLVKGAGNGFEATFRAAAYSYGANVFLVVPFCGGVIASLWGLVMIIIGLKEAQGTTGGKAAFAVVFPLILCCAFAVFVVLMVFGTIAASLGTISHQPWK